MKILAIISSINLPNFTRRATLEALSKKVSLEILFYTSFKNLFRQKISLPGIKSSTYHFWIPDKIKRYPIFSRIEHLLRFRYWNKRIASYDLIFISDPNQAWLLPYINEDKTVVYLIRDPNILQNPKQEMNESLLLNRANIVLATSENLWRGYVEKHYHIKNINIHFWPNCVDLQIWGKRPNIRPGTGRTIVGIAGNFGHMRTDYELIDFISSQAREINFEIAGKIDREESKAFWDRILAKENVRYLGIIPFKNLPEIVAGWSVGLVTDKIDEYASYMHHNKVYQYLASAVPVVSLKIHDDYLRYHPFVRIAENHKEYLQALYSAIENSMDADFRKNCRAIAELNSSEIRADQFISLIEKVNGLG